MFFYSAYGLTISSSFPIPELVPVVSPAADIVCDVTIRTSFDSHGFEKSRAKFTWSNVGTFWVHSDREIVFVPLPAYEETAARMVLLGQVLAWLLQERGYLTLHASGAALRKPNGQFRAVGFLGDSRQGKSTMAAAFHAAGHRAVADDIIAVPAEALAEIAASESAPPLIPPGFPTLKLWPEATAELYSVPEAEQPTPFSDYTPRRIRDVREAFSQDRLPLVRLYILEDGLEIRSERLNCAIAIQQLMRHAYWTPELLPVQKAALFQQCIRLCNRVDIYRLWRPRDLTRLPEVVKFIEREI